MLERLPTPQHDKKHLSTTNSETQDIQEELIIRIRLRKEDTEVEVRCDEVFV